MHTIDCGVDGPLFDRIPAYGRWDVENIDVTRLLAIVCEDVVPQDRQIGRERYFQGHFARGLRYIRCIRPLVCISLAEPSAFI